MTENEPIGEALVALDAISTVSEQIPLKVWVEKDDSPAHFPRNGPVIDPVGWTEIAGDGPTRALRPFWFPEVALHGSERSHFTR